MINGSNSPIALDASTYSWLLTVNTAALVIRTNWGMDVTPTAIIRFRDRKSVV